MVRYLRSIESITKKIQQRSLPSISLNSPLLIAFARSMELCGHCSAILPAGNENAVPHQPDLDCLRASAKTCRLCNLLSEAVDELLKEIEQPGKHVQAHFHYWKQFREGVMIRVDQGTRREYFKLQSECDEKSDRGFLFPSGPKGKEENGPLRPWLYGNWWTIPSLESNPKLLGMGVRVARGPSPFDAEGQGRCISGAVPCDVKHGFVCSVARLRSAPLTFPYTALCLKLYPSAIAQSMTDQTKL